MAGMLDNAKDKMGDMNEEMLERKNMLESKAKDGNIDDSERNELQQLRDRMKGHSSSSGQ